MRLDKFLFEKGYYTSRNKAAEAIERGDVCLNGKNANKSSTDVTENDVIHIKTNKMPYVSIGGYKLEKAINEFKPAVSDKIFIDVGSSTGGFTDCLLRHGAKKIYCIDVGENLLSPKLANDYRVIKMEKTNARYLTRDSFKEEADGIVVDCSFISLEYVLPPLIQLIKENGYILALIKPQFETCGRMKMKNGILRSDTARRKIIEKIYFFIIQLGLSFKDICLASTDDKKNKEYIAFIAKSGASKSLDAICEKILL